MSLGVCLYVSPSPSDVVLHQTPSFRGKITSSWKQHHFQVQPKQLPIRSQISLLRAGPGFSRLFESSLSSGNPYLQKANGKTASLFFFSINTSVKALPCQFLEPGNVLVGLMRRLGISSNTRSQIGDVKERVKRKWQNAAPPVTSCVPSHAALSHLCLLLILFPAFGMPSSLSLARWFQTCKVSNPDDW